MKNKINLLRLLAVLICEFHISSATCQNPVSEEFYTTVNGIKQWITIHGDKSKPAILFLHGGPGSCLSPYSRSIYKDWEKDFIIIQWDQRGACRTYGITAPEELDSAFIKQHPLSLDQMVSDGIALTEYLTKYLGKQKLILFGSSWGSVLGVMMASRQPSLYYAYVGHSQIVDPQKSFPLIYKNMVQITRKENDLLSENVLSRLGPPPYDSARNYGQLLRIIKKYERKYSVAAPDSLWKMEITYDNPKDGKDREDGDDYSFIHYTGDKQVGVSAIMSSIDFSKTNIHFSIPVYLIQGEQDILTSAEFTKPYFDRIKAPKKEYLLIPGAAHGFNQSVLDAQYKIMRNINAG